MKRQRDIHTLDIFADIPRAVAATPGALNCSIELRQILSAMLKTTPFSRYQIAARMSELLGEEVTKFQLDAWTAESRAPWRFPLEYAAAAEVASESTCLQEFLTRKRGSKILVGEESLLAELGRIDQLEAELKAQRQAIKQHLRGRK